MNTRELKKGETVTVHRGGEIREAVVAKTTPYREDFPFVLVALGERTVLIHRTEIENNDKLKEE